VFIDWADQRQLFVEHLAGNLILSFFFFFFPVANSQLHNNDEYQQRASNMAEVV